jgi:CRP/FNR family cyclic AMP-dependent transcriptional regulator
MNELNANIQGGPDSVTTMAAIIGGHPFFAGLDEAALRLIAGSARRVELTDGQLLFHTGEVADRFYLIGEGRVALDIYAPRQGRHTVQTIEDGEILGWSWLIPPFEWRFDARVVEGGWGLEIDGRLIRERCAVDHDLGYEVFKRFATLIGRRLESTRIQLMDLYGSTT